MSTCKPVKYSTQLPADIYAACGPAAIPAMIQAVETGSAMIGNAELAFMGYQHAADTLQCYGPETAIYSLTTFQG